MCHSAGLSCTGYCYCEWDACCSLLNKHTDEDQLAEEKQEDQREVDDVE